MFSEAADDLRRLMKLLFQFPYCRSFLTSCLLPVWDLVFRQSSFLFVVCLTFLLSTFCVLELLLFLPGYLLR